MKNNITSSSYLSLFFLFFSIPLVWSQGNASFVDFKELDVNSLNEIRLSTEENNWAYILDSLNYNGTETWPLKTASINGVNYSKSSFSYVKEAVFKADQARNSFFLELSEDRTLILDEFQKDPSLVRDVLATAIYSHFMVVPQVAYTKLYINDRFYGLMLIKEQVNKQFVETHFGNSYSEDPIKTKEVFLVEADESCRKGNYGSLRSEATSECIENLFEGDELNEVLKLMLALENEEEHLEKIMDVNSALWMLALNDVTMNFDSYSGYKSTNFYLVKDQFGRFNFVPFSLGMAFGGQKRVNGKSDLSMQEMAELPLAHQMGNYRYPLINRLLENEQYFKIYISNCRAIVNAYYKDQSFLTLAKSFQDLIMDTVEKDKTIAFSKERITQNLSTTVGEKSKVPGIEEIVKMRYDFLRKNTILRILGPEVESFSFQKRERFSSEKMEDFILSVVTDKYTDNVKIHYRFSDKQAFISTLLSDDGNHHDQEAFDKVFGVKISPPEGFEDLEFFLEADNAEMKSFFPDNFERQILKVNLKSLNK